MLSFLGSLKTGSLKHDPLHLRALRIAQTFKGLQWFTGNCMCAHLIDSTLPAGLPSASSTTCTHSDENASIALLNILLKSRLAVLASSTFIVHNLIEEEAATRYEL